MKPYAAIGWTLLQTTAITSIVGTRVWHGMRPETDTLPSINYYELSGTRRWGYETQPYSINCRASTAGAARDLARTVTDLFDGTSGTGIHGVQDGFVIARGSLRLDAGLIPEPDGKAYNAPIDIQIVYCGDTVT